MTMINPDDLIYVDSWAKLAEEIGGKIVYKSTEALPASFPNLPDGAILVSACCDYGLTEQEREPVNADLFKHSVQVPWDTLAKSKAHYHGVEIPSPCEQAKCRMTDRYSLKTDRWTWATFNEIPPHISRWYTTNLNIEHPKVSWIPFGLNNDGPGSSYIPKYMGREKTGLVYANFQHNSLMRLRLKQYLMGQRPAWITFRPEPNLPVEQYLEELASHQFVYCPFGNGYDCYRIYEAIYLGVIPILPDSIFSSYLLKAGLPVMVVDDYTRLTPEFLRSVYLDFLANKDKFDMSVVKLSWWREKLAKEAYE